VLQNVASFSKFWDSKNKQNNKIASKYSNLQGRRERRGRKASGAKTHEKPDGNEEHEAGGKPAQDARDDGDTGKEEESWPAPVCVAAVPAH